MRFHKINMKILIVEDDDILYKVLQEKFEDQNFDVAIAKEGDQVIPMAKKFKPDIIILDILLPKIGGVEVLSYLKSDDELANIPVIALSDVDDEKIIKEILILGAVEYLVKTDHPINEVIEKINKYLLKV